MEASFRKWWQESYGLPPGSHAVMTHVAWGEYLMSQLPMPTSEQVHAMADAASGGGEATLAEADQRLAEAVVTWLRQQ